MPLSPPAQRSMPKPIDIQAVPIAHETYVLRSRTWSRLKFEIEYGLQRGTTANSFLIQADQIALLDPPGETFTKIYLDAVSQRLDWAKLNYVILGHINANRATTLSAILARAPQLTVVCSNPAALSLGNLLPEADLNLHIVKGDDTLDLGQSHHLHFRLTPTPRWPGGLCTYDPATQILFTDKFFGAHVCGDQVFDEGYVVYAEDRRYYFDCVMAPSARQVEAALEKIADLPAQFYAPGHGPLLRYGRQDVLQGYRDWSQTQKSQALSVALFYASAYGNTATLAQAIARGVTKAGVHVESVNCEVASPDEISTIVEKADGFIIGSPTLGGHAPTQIQTALGMILSHASQVKLAGVFGSFGWSGEAIDLLESKLRDAGFQLGFETIRVKFKPTDITLKECEEAGTDFAQALRKAKKVRQSRQSSTLESQTDRTAQAVGRLVGSLCVVTARQGEVASAMLASWVSQATFDPPGLTVAVAKDRAVESLLYRGEAFTLNILAEQNHLGLMKHFLKPFAPGEDRFAGVETEIGENGCPILKDGLAYLECRVDNRMECGDHWLIYGTVQYGTVLDANGLTAVHHRKTGSHY
ncbi:flavin oxidoreductase [Synechococcales cyanobacterium C]|uniref:Flavin oxidoreductase n=1 Tax=Petrachloros mirabilis ULC683 TaxID=2781853 RepID=A0A8K2AC70_9CYAN|nr:diflavin flavoprotein [Petrachloros mirabilis]NCJ05733.1 flavin oxidoreductase [Petrachloros mirabilis ULC683]